MSVAKGSKIIAQEILDVLEVKDYIELAHYSTGSGPLLGTDSDNYYDYFWIRSNPTVYAYAVYSHVTVYAQGDKVSYLGSAYKCKINGTVGIYPSSSSNWTKLTVLSTVSGAWANLSLRVYSGSFQAPNSAPSMRLYKITWVNSLPVETLLDEFNRNMTNDQPRTYSLAPGFYKVHTYLTSGDAKASSAGTITAKRWDNTFVAESKIKTMASNYEELQPPTIVTAVNASAGRLSHPAYEGGDREGPNE